MNLFYVKFLKLLGIWPNIKFGFKDKQSGSDLYSDEAMSKFEAAFCHS